MTKLSFSGEAADINRSPPSRSFCSESLAATKGAATEDSMPSRFREIPREMRERRQWVLSRLEERDGAFAKIPMMPSGRRAKVNDPLTWSKYEDVLAVLGSGQFDAIGYVFTETDPYVGIDLDKCLNPDSGELEPDAQSVMDSMDSYTERSISGTGLHIIVKATMPATASNRDGHGLEIYSRGRYFVMTGDRLSNQPASINNRQTELEHTLRDHDLFSREDQDSNLDETLKESAAFDVNATMPANVAQILRDNKRLSQLWDMSRPLRNQKDTSHSGYGYLLLGQLALQGASKQELLDTLVAFRSRHEADQKSKGWHEDEVEKARKWSASQQRPSSTGTRRHPQEMALAHWRSHRGEERRLEAIDLCILQLLAAASFDGENSRLSTVDIARSIVYSVRYVSARLRRLQQLGCLKVVENSRRGSPKKYRFEFGHNHVEVIHSSAQPLSDDGNHSSPQGEETT